MKKTRFKLIQIEPCLNYIRFLMATFPFDYETQTDRVSAMSFARAKRLYLKKLFKKEINIYEPLF